jgi:hypothetical protein
MNEEHTETNWMAEGDRVAGGAEQHVELRAWAAKNMPKHELEEMNARVKAYPGYYPQMVSGLRDRQRAGGVTAPGSPFDTPREMHLA